jgi:hypothetical protein
MSAKPIQMLLPLSKTRTSRLRAGSLRTKEAVTEAIKKAVKNCHLDREDIAKELTRLVGEEFSIHALNNILSDGKQNRRFPLEFAKALTMITGDTGVLKAALQPEFDLMDEEGRAAHDYGLLLLENKARSKRKKELELKANNLLIGRL